MPSPLVERRPRDLLLGGDGHDTVDAGGGDDSITPGAGNDVVSAGAGNDWIYVRDNWSEFDTLDGADGFDRVINTAAGRIGSTRRRSLRRHA